MQRWVHRFEEGGFAGLQDGERPGRPSALDERQRRQLQRDVRRPPGEVGHTQNLWDGKLLSAHLKKRFQIDLGARQRQRLFHQIGFRLRKPRPQVAQSDPIRVAAVKKLRRLGRRADIDLWSLDECHFQQHGTRTRIWIAPEVKGPVVLHASTRKSISCFGAVCLNDGRFVWTMEPKFNAESFERFLRRLVRHRCRGRRMVVVLDNAGYHHARALRPFLNTVRNVLTLLFLPPYSPQLAPIERVWKLARRLATHNQYFPILAQLIAALVYRFQRWHKPNRVLHRLCCNI